MEASVVAVSSRVPVVKTLLTIGLTLVALQVARCYADAASGAQGFRW